MVVVGVRQKGFAYLSEKGCKALPGQAKPLILVAFFPPQITFLKV